MRARRLTRRACAILFGLILTALVVEAWYPFDADPPGYVANGAERQADGSLRFSAPPVRATTAGPASWLVRAIDEQAFSLDLDFRPARALQFGPARIFSVSAGTRAGNLMVGQFGSDIVVRLAAPGGRTLEFSLGNALVETSWHRLVVTLRDEELTLEVDGRVEVKESVSGRLLDAWDPRYRVSLGNEVSGDRPWRGEIRGVLVTVGGDSTDHLHPGDIVLPVRYWYLPSRLDHALDVPLSAKEAVLLVPKVLGFGLLGFLAYRIDAPRDRARRWVVLVAAASLLLELSKIGFEGRHPSLVDAGLRALGGVAGVWVSRRRPAPDAPRVTPSMPAA